jgi:protocatechuate 3,4-dioxygenase, beta subunit
MSLNHLNPSRRELLRNISFGAAALATPLALAESLTPTPRQTEGPFYPDRMPLDTDNDLLLIGDAAELAVGEITHLGGRVLDIDGRPVRNALVEIWQVDGNGVYLHTRSAGERRDANFQGYGRFLTNPQGEYYFRTVKPVLYPGRQAPHIHFAINRNGKRLLTTQLYVEGNPGNERDGVYRSIRDDQQRMAVTVPFAGAERLPDKELLANFDIVLGRTPADG